MRWNSIMLVCLHSGMMVFTHVQKAKTTEFLLVWCFSYLMARIEVPNRRSLYTGFSFCFHVVPSQCIFFLHWLLVMTDWQDRSLLFGADQSSASKYREVSCLTVSWICRLPTNIMKLLVVSDQKEIFSWKVHRVLNETLNKSSLQRAFTHAGHLSGPVMPWWKRSHL